MTLTEILLNKMLNFVLGMFGWKRQTPGIRDWFWGIYNNMADSEQENQRLAALGRFPKRLFVAMDGVVTRRTSGAFALNPAKAREFAHQYQIGVTMNGLSDPKVLTQLEGILEERLTDMGMAYDVKFATRPLRLIIDKKSVPVQKLSEHLPVIGKKFADGQFSAFAGVCWNETGQQEYYYQSLADTCGFSTVIFGSSGSGKSQMGADFLATMLYLNSPQDLGVIIVDPKMEDFTAFDGCPHLLAPVIGDIDAAIQALHWLVAEMDRRVADKTNVKKRILFYCDEIADLIAQDEQVVKLLQRLCQKGRSLGIGVILATQRAVGSGLGNVLMNISVRCVGRLPSQQESVFASGVQGTNTSKSRGKGDFLIFSADHDGLQIQGFWFDKPEEICATIADKWQGKRAHTEIHPGDRTPPTEPPTQPDFDSDLFESVREAADGDPNAVTGATIRALYTARTGKNMDGSRAKRLRESFVSMMQSSNFA